MQGIEKRLEALGEKLGCSFKYTEDGLYVYNEECEIAVMCALSSLMYNILVYTNYVASFEESSEAEPKSFTDFIFSKEYNTDFEILTNHIIDTLVKDENDAKD